ncbi:MAG: SIMPL domain-containing protein [Rhizobiaceae bacterium]|nr:SIMPL domain-containing protein [Hyphomicrobiales bacterium]NRB31188.1 SIMPL domain-containing protein [Rhizobiaceae bacterium]
MKFLPLIPLAAALPLASAITLAPLAATAQETAQNPAVISVSATGSASVVPDMARLDLTVQRQAKTARAALDANNKAMAAVLAEMKQQGIEERDLQTSNFSIQPQYDYPKSSSGGRKAPKLIGYSVSNSLTVRIRDLSRLGSILDKSVSLGVNSGGGITFTTDKPAPVIEQARKNAVASAIAKARTLTEAAGVSLGRILEISETNRQPPRPRAMARMETAMAADAAVPVAAGENSYSVTVNIRWALDQ